jgi:hypothetical protein
VRADIAPGGTLPNGKLAAARIYDDADPSARSTHVARVGAGVSETPARTR